MERLSIFCVLLATVSSRVPDSPSVLALNNLLSGADPTDNEVYFEAPLTYDSDKQQDISTDLEPINDSPVQGEIFPGSPKYVDTSEFRSQLRGVLPPFLDINRHLTLLRASSGRTIPEEYIPATDEISKTNYEFLPRSASLLHSDFLRDEPIVEEEVVPEEEVISSSVAFQKREPLSHPLSPLGHILAGFQSEIGPFGGDVSTARFMSSFRPDDF